MTIKDELYDLISIIGVTIVLAFFIFFSEAKTRLLIGGIFLIVCALGDWLMRRRKFSFWLKLVPGLIGLFVLILLPKYVNLFLFFFYFGFLIGLVFLLYFCKRKGDTLEDNALEKLFRWLHIIISVPLSIISFVLIKGLIIWFTQPNIIGTSWLDYLFFMIASLISFSSFFLFWENVLRLLIIGRSSKIFGKINYSIIHSFFLSLCTIIIVGGYYYINYPHSELLDSLIKIIGLIFTVLTVSISLREFLRK